MPTLPTPTLPQLAGPTTPELLPPPPAPPQYGLGRFVVACVTTFIGVAVPFAWVGRLLGVPTIYVESVTRIEGLSLSGRMIKPVAKRLYAQWPELAESSSGVQFAGNLFAAR